MQTNERSERLSGPLKTQLDVSPVSRNAPIDNEIYDAVIRTSRVGISASGLGLEHGAEAEFKA